MAILFALAAALSGLASANVQRTSGPDGAAIVVEGRRSPKQAANNYIDQVLPPTFDAELGRFEAPLCPDAVGLPDNLKAEVLGRIRRVSQSVGIPLAGAGCRANLLIVVVDDKKALIEGMRSKKQAYLYGVDQSRLKRLERSPAPVVAWQISDVIGADGMPLRVDGNGFPRLFTTSPPSRIVQTTRRRLIGGVVVIEQRGLVDVTTRQIADYALVRAMAPIEPRERAAPGSSVLSLFDGSADPTDAPQSVTWWDVAFLKALFATRADVQANVQRDEIRTRMLAEMARVPGARQ